ncbi:hypothetical protein [Actinoplanes sp. NPDC049118]|uniref:hypothetical protein n=1 Tax=Actinoplanes sp. NPDC049118 TaxID=3155769 RepID=UPI0033D42AC0
MTHSNTGGGPEQPSTEVTLLRPLFVLTPEAAARPADPTRPPRAGWAGLVGTAGPVPGGGGDQGVPAPVAPGRAASGRNRRGGDRVRRRVAVVAAIAVAVVAGLGLVVFGPDSDRTAERAGGDPLPGTAMYPALADPSAAVSFPVGATPARSSDLGTPPAVPVGGGPTPLPVSTPVRHAPTRTASPPPRGATFAAVSGESCPQSSDRGYRLSGWHSDWYTRSSGGWRSDGCGGKVVAVPMSGSATKDDSDNVIVWWFRTGAVRAGSCSVGVYVPGTGNPKDAAGKPAHYLVRSTADIDGAVIGQFDVNQSANQGRWVDAGSYGTTTGELSVQLVTRGIDWGSGRDGDHLGVSALRVNCQAG